MIPPMVLHELAQVFGLLTVCPALAAIASVRLMRPGQA